MNTRPAFFTYFRPGLILAVAALGVLVGATFMVAPQAERVADEPAPPARGSAAWMVEKYDCWTGEAPADMQGEIPGHVIATVGDDADPTYGGTRLVAQALGQIFDGEDHDLTVHAFCR